MAVSRLDAAAAADGLSIAYAIGAGSDRYLVAAHQQEGTVAQPTATWGGRNMTHLVGIVATGSVDQRVDFFGLPESEIALGVGTTTTITGGAGVGTTHVASYASVDQATPVPETNSDQATAATPNPLTLVDIVAADGSAVVSFSGCGNGTTASWANVTEQTEQADGTSTTTGSLADTLVVTGATIDPECTWASQNRAAAISIELLAAPESDLDQEGYRWRNDDGTETTATFRQAQDTVDAVAKQTRVRLRVLIDESLAGGDAASEGFLLTYDQNGDDDFRQV